MPVASTQPESLLEPELGILKTMLRAVLLLALAAMMASRNEQSLLLQEPSLVSAVFVTVNVVACAMTGKMKKTKKQRGVLKSLIDVPFLPPQIPVSYVAHSVPELNV